jgi:hypothetical protein
MSTPMQIDLADGRRLLDAYKRRPHIDNMEAWEWWTSNNAEAVLTLLEQARDVLEPFADADSYDDPIAMTDAPKIGVSYKQFTNIAALYRSLTTTSDRKLG